MNKLVLGSLSALLFSTIAAPMVQAEVEQGEQNNQTAHTAHTESSESEEARNSESVERESTAEVFERFQIRFYHPFGANNPEQE